MWLNQGIVIWLRVLCYLVEAEVRRAWAAAESGTVPARDDSRVRTTEGIKVWVALVVMIPFGCFVESYASGCIDAEEFRCRGGPS